MRNTVDADPTPETMRALINLFDNSIHLIADRIENVPERPGYVPVTLTEADLEVIENGPAKWSFEDPEHPEVGEVVSYDPPAKVPAVVPAWRIRVVAKVTPLGEGTLHDAIVAAIDALEGAAHHAAHEIYFGGNVLERNSSLLVQLADGLGLTNEQIDELFINVGAIEV